ncbi:MAG: hypothetical protein HeimC3_17190 [Candidatus Heimdallarchaeota archaeon LC_3]|nr:MAG: hypothetical protein HeimC3_17190 [Candidatus Heimdallarchaeota archaeon LC_3]
MIITNKFKFQMELIIENSVLTGISHKSPEYNLPIKGLNMGKFSSLRILF